MLAGLTACATAEPPRTANDTACIALRAITYANAKAGQEFADDPGNKLDTAETVKQVQEHNARWRAICAALPL